MLRTAQQQQEDRTPITLANILRRFINDNSRHQWDAEFYGLLGDRNRRAEAIIVLNPVIGQWESQDSDFDLYWRIRSSGARVSVVDAAEDLSDLEPCGHRSCGWDVVEEERQPASMLRDYFDIISVTDKTRNSRVALHTAEPIWSAALQSMARAVGSVI